MNPIPNQIYTIPTPNSDSSFDFGIAPGLAQPHCHLGFAHAIVYGQATTSIIIIVCTYKCIHIPYCPVIKNITLLDVRTLLLRSPDIARVGPNKP